MRDYILNNKPRGKLSSWAVRTQRSVRVETQILVPSRSGVRPIINPNSDLETEGPALAWELGKGKVRMPKAQLIFGYKEIVIIF